MTEKIPGTGNTWTAVVAPTLKSDGTTIDTTIECDDGTIITPTLTATTIKFNTNGAYNAADSTIGTLTLKYTPTSGGAGVTDDQEVSFSFTDVTQFAGNSTINASGNGNAAGTLSSISVDASGVITGTYTNGLKQAEAQIAVAQFTNASGLTKTGNSLYQESNNSGTPNVKTAADLGVTITPSALEMSNVDVANEFADMIITQRGFQSNSKIVTVGDEMLETVINMKR
jgi:flagellar hook protein FlgE